MAEEIKKDVEKTVLQPEEVEMPKVDEFVKIEDPNFDTDKPEVITSDVQVVEPNNQVVTPAPEENKPVEVTVAKPKQKAKVKYKNGKIVSIEPVVSDEEKKKAKEEKKLKKIMKKGKRHYGWRYFLVFLTGIIFTLGVIAGGAFAVTTLFSASQVVSLFGVNPDDVFTEEYQDKTILELITSIVGGEVSFNNLEGIRELTPYVDVLIDEINYVLDDAIGFTFDKEELYKVEWAYIGDYIFSEIQTGIKLAKVLNVTESSSSVLIYLAYNSNEDGTTNWNSPRSLGDLMNNMDSIINNARIGDLIDVGTSGILYNLRDVKVGEMAQAMETRPLNQIIDIAPDAFPALLYLGNFAVSELNEALENATLEDLLPIDEGSILYNLRDKKLDEIPEEIQHLTLGEVITIDESSPAILKYLKDTPIDQITSMIDTMPLDVAIEINSSSPKFLRTLAARGATISNIGSLINDLTLGDMVDIGDSRILSALAGSTLDTLASDVDNLTIGDIVDTNDPNAPKILKSLAGYRISELGDAIHNLKIEQIVDITADSPMILKALVGTNFEDLEAKIHTLSIGDLFTQEEIDNCIFLSAMGSDTLIDNFADRVNELTFVEVFKDSIYENPNDPSTIKSTWKYLLKDASGTIRTDYKLAFDMGQMIENMERNIQKATLSDLYNDGFVALSDPSILDKSIFGQRIGDLTIQQLIELVASFAS